MRAEELFGQCVTVNGEHGHHPAFFKNICSLWRDKEARRSVKSMGCAPNQIIFNISLSGVCVSTWKRLSATAILKVQLVFRPLINSWNAPVQVCSKFHTCLRRRLFQVFPWCCDVYKCLLLEEIRYPMFILKRVLWLRLINFNTLVCWYCSNMNMHSLPRRSMYSVRFYLAISS